MSSPAIPDSRYRSVVETMSEGVVVQGADGATELCNARALELFGVTEGELRASFSERGQWRAVRLDGSAYADDELPVNVTLRTGEATRDVVMGITRRDGARLWLSVNTSAIREDGRVRAVVCQALEVLAGEPEPASILLLTDIMMPGMSGHELAARVAERFPMVRITAMSGFSADELARRGHALLPQLHKPFTLPQLLTFVNDAFAETRAVA